MHHAKHPNLRWTHECTSQGISRHTMHHLLSLVCFLSLSSLCIILYISGSCKAVACSSCCGLWRSSWYVCECVFVCDGLGTLIRSWLEKAAQASQNCTHPVNLLSFLQIPSSVYLVHNTFLALCIICLDSIHNSESPQFMASIMNS